MKNVPLVVEHGGGLDQLLVIMGKMAWLRRWVMGLYDLL